MIPEQSSHSFRLPEEAMRLLVDTHAARGSPIDPAARSALSKIIHQFYKLLNDRTQQDRMTYYLASLDPGVGKTEAACVFLKAWKAQGFLPEGGVLIAVSRLDEIESYIERSGLDTNDFAVLVGEDAPVGLKGRKDRTKAPVLFTTHEMVRRRCHRRTFREVSAFHYKVDPRACRIWDESLLPALPATLRLDSIHGLLEPLRPTSQGAISLVEALIEQINATAPGEAVEVPLDFLNLGPNEIPLEARERARWDTLVSWAGRQVMVIQSNHHGLELVGTTGHIPADFAPAVVLDASGRVRHTYRVWEERGDNLVRLSTAANDYRQLRIHHWDRPGGRSALKVPETRQQVLQVASDLISSEPRVRWLVVHHMARGGDDIASELRDIVDGDRDRVQFIHWGNHHGTNAYRDIDRVLVLGLWHLPASVLHAHYLAGGVSEAELEGPKDLHGMQTGEHQHNLLQAVCRTAVRKSTDGIGGACTAYIVGSLGRNGLAVLADTYPGAHIEDWRPLEIPLKGRAKQVTDSIEQRFSVPEVTSVRKAAIREDVGFRTSQDLAQVLGRAEVKKWLTDRDLELTTRDVRRLAA